MRMPRWVKWYPVSLVERPPKHSHSAGCFVPFFDRFGLRLASTFSENVREGSNQYTFSQRHDDTMAPCRLDCIVVTDRVSVQPGSAEVLDDFETYNGTADHKPVVTKVVCVR